jgi:hypothetical protein
VKVNVITVITGVTETISNSLRQYLSNIPGKHKIKEWQETAILGTAHNVERANVKVQNILLTYLLHGAKSFLRS